MPSITNKLGLVKADPNDLADHIVALNNNLTLIDSVIGDRRNVRLYKSAAPNTPEMFEVFTQTWSHVFRASAANNRDPFYISFQNVVVGDWIEIGMNGQWSDSNTEGYIGLAFCRGVLSGGGFDLDLIPTSYFGSACASGTTGTFGIPAWRGESLIKTKFGGKVMKQVAAGDLIASDFTLDPTSSFVVVGFFFRTSGPVTKFIHMTTESGFHITSANLGRNP